MTKPKRTLETPVKDDIRAILREKKVWFRMIPANGYGVAGNFDFVCCVDGAFLGIEAKRDEKEKPTQLQHENAIEARNAKGVTLLIHKGNVALVAAVIDVMRARMRLVQHAYDLSVWPVHEAPAPDDTPEPVVRRKEKV
jgi:hypothetical protein